MLPPVTVYTTPDCAACQAVKTYLTRHGVPFTERHLRDDPSALADLRAHTEVRIAPVTVVGDEVFFGPFEERASRSGARPGPRTCALIV